ncbi:MAG: chromosomal replication initiator protein DnaA [Acidobacteria bacterium]|jgi:chromosomal replication initiator protein|nr:chromosomal replication initiator protein DnaA [Acidobacteriota bacterium]
MNSKMKNFELVKTYLEKTLGKPTFDEWIAPLTYIGTNNDIAYIGSADIKKNIWIKQNLLDKINKHTKEEFNITLKLVSFHEGGDDLESISPPAPGIPANEGNNINTNYKTNFNSNLKSRYTFENFVQVDQNRMAYSFAYSVSEFPSKSYNPLYIYSDVGLGKTHLMNAIGNRILQNDRNMKVIYCTSNEFMNEYVEYNRLNKRMEFIHKYTSVDVLLIDDIQYITKWEGTSEQFYYIFNQLRELDKQIVLCSDKHPDYIPNLEHRIKSRFEWGAVVDILHYDLEGRLAILKSKLTERKDKDVLKNHFEIPEEILYYIASSIKDNVRKMEGALNRLIGVADLKFSDTGNPITLQFAKEALKPIISLSKKPVTIERIQEYIAKEHNVTKADLLSKSNKREIAFPRQIAMYITKKLTKTPLQEIGEQFGHKHHSTVLHSINKVESQIETDYEFARQMESFIKFLEE